MRSIPAALLACAALAVPTASFGQVPLAASATASPEATLAKPAEPIRVEIPTGSAKATAPATVGPERTATFLFAAPARAALTIGVASQSGEARLTIYEPGATRPAPGTERETGCIRWIGQSTTGGELRIEVHTTGAETPVRLEVSIDRHLDFNSGSD